MSIRFWLAHNKFRLCSALVFVLVFSLLAFAPPLSFDAGAIAVADDAIFLVLIAFLASVGITLVSDSHTSSLDLIGEAVHDYASSIGETWENIKTGFQFGVDKLGNILTNNSVLGFFSGFSDWMTRFYGLSDNTTSDLVSPEETYFLGDIPLDYFPSFPSSVSSPSVTISNWRVWNSVYGFSYIDSDTGQYGIAVFSLNVPTYYVQVYVNGDLVYSTNQNGMNSFGPFRGIIYRDPGISRPLPLTLYDTPISRSEIVSLLSGNNMSSEIFGDSVSATVGTIDIPADGTNYDDSDGAVIGGVGAWGDSWNDILDKLREWLDSQSDSAVADPSLSIELESQIAEALETDLLSTDNWPGLIGPLSLHEFSFSSIWHYVTDWLGLYSGTLATVLGISFALPAVSIVYAVIVISLAVWLLRKVT